MSEAIELGGVPAPPRLALCLECMQWWNADGGHICPDDRTENRSHRVALYSLTFEPCETPSRGQTGVS